MQVKALFAAVVLTLAPLAASAATVLAVEGPDSGSTLLGVGLPDVGVAQSFTTTETLEDASITFDLTCFACGGELWLIRGIMDPTVVLPSVLAAVDYSFTGGAQSALSGLTLTADTYTIIMTMTSGQGLWRATDEPVTTGTVGTVENGYRAFSTEDPNSLVWSPTRFIADRTLQFSIDTPDGDPGGSGGDPSPNVVPLPASAGFLIAGVVGLAAAARRKTR